MPICDELLAEIDRELQKHKHCQWEHKHIHGVKGGIATTSISTQLSSSEIIGFHRGLHWMRKVIESYKREED